MLLLYYTSSVLFYVGIPYLTLNFKQSHVTNDLIKDLDIYDFEQLPDHVCIARCLEVWTKPSSFISNDKTLLQDNWNLIGTSATTSLPIFGQEDHLERSSDTLLHTCAEACKSTTRVKPITGNQNNSSNSSLLGENVLQGLNYRQQQHPNETTASLLSTAQTKKSVATKDSLVKRIHESYTLNLLCREDTSLSFLIELHSINKNSKNENNNGNLVKTETLLTTTQSNSSVDQSLFSSHADFRKKKEDVSDADDDDDDATTDDTDKVKADTDGYADKHADEDFTVNGSKTVYVIKFHLTKNAENYSLYLSDDNIFTINELRANTSYNMTVLAVHANNQYSVIAKQQQFKTLRRGYTPAKVKSIRVTDFIEDKWKAKYLSATLKWTPSSDMTCHYDIVCFSPENEEYEFAPLEIRDPHQLFSHQLENLTFSFVYKVGIRAQNSKNMQESELLWETFRAPSCVEWFNYNYTICAPDTPRNLTVEQQCIEQNVYSLNITWSKPTQMPDNYMLRVQDLSPNGILSVFNLTKETHNFYISRIEIYGLIYEVSLTAFTVGGENTAIFTDFKKSVVHMTEKNHFMKSVALILAPICCVAILSLTIFMIYHRKAKLKRYQERCKYFEELEKKAPLDPKENFDFVAKEQQQQQLNQGQQQSKMEILQQFQKDLEELTLINDEMEIDRNNLTLHEILGEGAFGLVKRGIYKNLRKQTTHEVAVKMLKDQRTVDDVRAFRREIEVMKSVEKHPNIVGIIGHCTRHGNELMLLTEYCRFGNLLDFLRNEWRFLHDLQLKRQRHSLKRIEVELPHIPDVNSMSINSSLTEHQQHTSHSEIGSHQKKQKSNGIYLAVNRFQSIKCLKNAISYDNTHKLQCNHAKGFTADNEITTQNNDDDDDDDDGDDDEDDKQQQNKNQAIERFSQKYNKFLIKQNLMQQNGSNNIQQQQHLPYIHTEIDEKNKKIVMAAGIPLIAAAQSENNLQRNFLPLNLAQSTTCLAASDVAAHNSSSSLCILSTATSYNCSPLTTMVASTPAAKESPATENKSYDYHSSLLCTSSCKCHVDVVIRHIDSSDSSREQMELELFLKRQEQQGLHDDNSNNNGSNENLNCCSKRIHIRNCECHFNDNKLHAPQHILSTSSQSVAELATTTTTTTLKNSPAHGLEIVNDNSTADIEEQQVQQSVFLKNEKNKSNQFIFENKTYFKNYQDTNSITMDATATTATGTMATCATICKNNPKEEYCATWSQDTITRIPLTASDLLDIARQVAVGMEFLAKNKVVHRDLAARNVLVAPDRTIKIADFGLSRDVYQENIYKKTGNGKLPIKWLALESMTHQVYTTQSDVWSYGILLYEIITLGATPYPSIPTNRLLHLLKSGYRMEKPKNSGQEFYDLMFSCWNAVPSERPTFHEIIKKLDRMLNNCLAATEETSTLFANDNSELCLATTNRIEILTKDHKDKGNNDDDDDDDQDDDTMVDTEDNPKNYDALSNSTERSNKIQQILSDEDSYLKPL